MKQIFFASTLMWGAEPEQIFRTAARYGAGGLELWAQQAAAFGWRAVDLARLADTFHVRLIVHAKSWDLNFAALNTGIRRASLQELKKSLFFASALGAEEITVHPPRFTLPALKNQAILAGREGLEELLECSEQLQVPLSLEVMEKLPKELVTSVDEYQDALSRLGQAGKGSGHQPVADLKLTAIGRKYKTVAGVLIYRA